MSRKLLSSLLTVLLVAPSGVLAQVPYMQVHYDADLTQTVASSCPSRLVELYVAVCGANAYISAIEFSIGYPADMTWIGDTHIAPLYLGTSPDGVAITFSPAPLSGFLPVVVMRATVMTTCDVLNDLDVIDVLPHGTTGFRRLVTWPNYSTVDLDTQSAYLDGYWGPPYHPPYPPGCNSPVPVETHTWGMIKSLYRQ